MSRFTESPHQQGTEEWAAERIGMVTGSPIAALFTTGKGLTRATYREHLRVEILTGQRSKASFTNSKTEWGHEQEPAARMAYEIASGRDVKKHGFIKLNNMNVGCSLDGSVDDMAGIVEIKCPDSHTHFSYIVANEVPKEYVPQVNHNLWVTGAKFCDFISFDPRAPEGLQLLIVHYVPDESVIKAHEAAVFQFLMELKRDVKILTDIQAARLAAIPF